MFQIALDYLKTLYSGTGYIKKTKSKHQTKAVLPCQVKDTGEERMESYM